MIRVCLAGATGWAGSELARSIANVSDITIVAAVSRQHAGRILGDVLGEPRLNCPVLAMAGEAVAIGSRSKTCVGVDDAGRGGAARTSGGISHRGTRE